MADETPDEVLRDILRNTRTIAMVGVSANPVRPSNFVVRYLIQRGYRVFPINPRQAGQRIYGRTVLADISEIPATERVDMLDVFRRAEAVPEILEQALGTLSGLRTLWLQIGVRNEEAARRAREAGLAVVQDRCPKMEHQRLFGELRKGGIATGIISSKLPTDWQRERQKAGT